METPAHSDTSPAPVRRVPGSSSDARVDDQVKLDGSFRDNERQREQERGREE